MFNKFFALWVNILRVTKVSLQKGKKKMFGYVRPFKSMLLVCELDEYKAVYCTLCKTLGKKYNPVTRMMLNYDLTFYTMLALDGEKLCPKVVKGRCVVNPLKPCNYINTDSVAYHKGAALTVLMTYHKLLDNIHDDSFLKSLVSRFLLLFIKGSAKKAGKDFPELSTALETMTKAQTEVELLENPSIDACCEPTANCLSSVFSDLAKSDSQKQVLSQLGYFLGRWIYTMDAADDLKDDLKSNSFNPLRQHFNIKGETIDETTQKNIETEVNQMLNNNVAMLLPALNLVDTHRYESIMNNILSKGLAQIQKEILFLHIRDKERKKKHDRSI